VIVGQDVPAWSTTTPEPSALPLPLGHVGSPVAERITAEEALEKVVRSAVVALVLVVRGTTCASAAGRRRPRGSLGKYVVEMLTTEGSPVGNLAECVGQFHGVGNHQRRRSGRYLAILGCLYTRVNQGADHDSDRTA